MDAYVAIFLWLVITFGVSLGAWFYLLGRLRRMDARIEEVAAAARRLEWNAKVRQRQEESRAAAPPSVVPPPPPPAPPPIPLQSVVLPVVPQPHPTAEEPVPEPLPAPPRREPSPNPAAPAPSAPQPAGHPAPRPSGADWELIVGGNWLNKAGVLVSVIAIGLLLNYAWAHVGPLGRVAMSYAAAAAMLGGGIWAETRQRFRAFGYGLIGGGWAALYLTTYAMHGVPAARILDSPLLAAVLLLAVALAMVAHSLKYRSQTVTALAAFIAFLTLVIGEVTTFSVLALIPLAAALLYVAYRNQWARFAVFALIATYVTCGLQKDNGAPLWQIQALFLAYWLLYEAFDLVRADRWLLPLNALGFLALSAWKWQHAAPQQMWQLAAGASGLYLASALLRARSGRWRAAMTLHAALAAAAIFLKLHDQGVPLALFVAAEVYYLAGIRFRARWMCYIAGAMFGLELGHLLLGEVGSIPLHAWEPVAIATAAAFYLNRAVCAGDVWFGYAAAGLAALVSGFEARPEMRGPVWSLMSLAPFTWGWWRHQPDFRVQAYGLALAGAVATALFAPYPPLAFVVGAVVAYTFVQCALRSAEGRLHDQERDLLRLAASAAAVLAGSALVWKLVPGEFLGIAWLALAVILLEVGLLNQPREFRWQGLTLAFLGVARAAGHDLTSKRALIAGALTYWLAARARKEPGGGSSVLLSGAGTVLIMAGLGAWLAPPAVSPAWALLAVVLAGWKRRNLSVQSAIVSGVVFWRCIVHDFNSAYAIAGVIPVIACYCATLLRSPVGSYTRFYYSLLASGIAAALIGQKVSGSMLTIAWGFEGVALLGAGFPLRDRVLRFAGLAMLLGCIGKLFFWDLRNLETLPRILSFIVLGALLVTVSWVYTRFRDQVQRYF